MVKIGFGVIGVSKNVFALTSLNFIKLKAYGKKFKKCYVIIYYMKSSYRVINKKTKFLFSLLFIHSF